MNSNLYTQDTFELNGRHAFIYLISTPIGDIYAVQYESPTKEIMTKLIDGSYDKALKAFRAACQKILKEGASA